MVLGDILEKLDVRGGRCLGFLGALGELQPLLEAPQIVVDLLPITLRAERTR